MAGKRSGGRVPRGGCSVAAGIAVFVAVGIAILWFRGSANPTLTIPAKVPPVNNGFDKLRNAANLLTGTDPFLSTKIDPAAEKNYVDANQQTLAAARDALTYPYIDMTPRSPNALFPYFAQYRKIARLYLCESHVKSKANDYSGAASSALDAIQLGETVPKGSIIIGKLVGIACEAIGRRPLRACIPHLSAVECKELCKRYESLCRLHVSEQDTLTEEKYYGQQALMMAFRGGQAGSLLWQGNGQPPSAINAMAQLYFLFHSKRSIIENYTNYFDHVASNSVKPWPQAKTVPPIPSDPIIAIITPTVDPTNFKDRESSITDNAICLTSMALQGYKMEHGSYPESLEKLCPSFLSHIPDDPFAASGSLKYRKEGSTYVLYSIGPDGVDDGGRPIDDPSKATTKNPDARYYPDKESKGDIVAGKNLY